MRPSRNINQLLEIMAALRRPETGCPWDQEQTFESIVPFTIEEAYEVADAVARHHMADFKEELGDLLLQVVFQARIAEEGGFFDFGDVVEAIAAKLIRRHPHVFGAPRGLSPDEVRALWSTIKAGEKAAKEPAGQKDAGADRPSRKPLLSDVPLALPGLTRAAKLQTKAGGAGFEWEDARHILAKIRAETAELEEALESREPRVIEAEIGDLLFAMANLARRLNIDPESAIRKANAKFERRFGFIEDVLAGRGKRLTEATFAEMESLWKLAKEAELGSARKA